MKGIIAKHHTLSLGDSQSGVTTAFFWSDATWTAPNPLFNTALECHHRNTRHTLSARDNLCGTPSSPPADCNLSREASCRRGLTRHDSVELCFSRVQLLQLHQPSLTAPICYFPFGDFILETTRSHGERLSFVTAQHIVSDLSCSTG